MQITQLYPNPATDQVNLKLQAPGIGMANFRVLSAEGRVERSGSFQLREGENNWQLPVQNLSPGLYQLVLDNGGNAYRTRFIRR